MQQTTLLHLWLLIGALPALGQATSSMALHQAVLALDSVPANEANPIDALGYLDEATAEDHKMADTLIREEQVTLHSVLPPGSADTVERLPILSSLLCLAEADGEALRYQAAPLPDSHPPGPPCQLSGDSCPSYALLYPQLPSRRSGLHLPLSRALCSNKPKPCLATVSARSVINSAGLPAGPPPAPGRGEARKRAERDARGGPNALRTGSANGSE